MNNRSITLGVFLFFTTFHLFAQQKSELFFLENVGQIHDQHGEARKDIDFVLQGNGLNIFISRNKISYQFAQGNKLQRIDACLEGASIATQAVAEQKQGFYENHYYNSQLTGIAHSYKKIVYRNIYPHIDWVLKINTDNTFEYEYLLGTLGDVNQIKMEYKGATSIRLANNGDLVIQTPSGSIKEQAPMTYAFNGQLINSRYVLNNNKLSYQTDPYKGALVIDPKVAWATYYGDTSDVSLTAYTEFQAIQCSNSGKVFAAGITRATKNIATSGAYQTTLVASDASKYDLFYLVVDSLGNRLYATYFGSTKSMFSARISVLKDTLYLAGDDGSGSIATAGAQQTSFSPYPHAPFLAKFNHLGHLQWATYCGGDSIISSAYVTADTLGNIYLAGATKNPTNIATLGAYRTSPIDSGDAYLVKYNSAGKRIWGTYFGGKGQDIIVGGLTFMSNDGTGAIYAVGNTSSDTGIATPSAFQTTYAGKYDAMLIKFDTAGRRVWGTYFGGEGSESVYGLNQDGKKNIYLMGSTSSTMGIASSTAYQKTKLGSTDAFIVKFNSLGTRLWSTYWGADKQENPSSSAVDTIGNIYIVGKTQSTTKIADSAAFQSKYAGGLFDGFIAGFTPEGKKFWSSYYGGEGNDNIMCAASDGVNLYFGGTTNSKKGIATKGSFLDTNSNGGGHGFLAKISEPWIGYKQPDTAVGILQSALTYRNVTLYPNPNNGNFEISLIAEPNAELTITIYDVMGKVVWNNTITNIKSDRIIKVVDISNIPSGIYILNCKSQYSNTVIQFTKK